MYWYSKYSFFRFNATCYLWCSPEGTLPEPISNEEDEDLLKELLEGTTNVEDIELSEDPVSHALSPIVVYRTSTNQVLLERIYIEYLLRNIKLLCL